LNEGEAVDIHLTVLVLLLSLLLLQKKTLQDWLVFFEKRYPVVGELESDDGQQQQSQQQNPKSKF
jgi:hypothetical protein